MDPSSAPKPRNVGLEHTVVLMFENRSFDNVLGYLYRPGEVPSFEGVAGRETSFSNLVPPDLAAAGAGAVPVHPATNLDTPDPDPGEEHPHTNTQLFGTVAPPDNRFKAIRDMRPPFNAPADPAASPSMAGFVADYIAAFRVEMGRLPSPEEYAQIMACYTPDQLPVLSTLAKGFACFDHWFCEVPSQTYCNRSFFHAASSSGYVLNGPVGKFATGNTAPTIFERLHSAGLSWKVYIDPEQLVPATALIHARNLAQFFGDYFSTIFDFCDDARNGVLPRYAFIEPNMLHPHTDMHPPGAGRIRAALHLRPPNAMIGGEQLLARVYDAVRTSATAGGSNYANTLLLVTFDEHGGMFDHVPPPKAPPPDPAAPAGEEGFRFDRSGVRIPALAISAWIDPRTVVTSEYRSTSLIRTLRERWGLGGPLTQRDAIAADLAPLLTRSTPRPPGDWPTVTPRPLGVLAKVEEMAEFPLSRLERDLVGEALAHESRATARPPAGDSERMSRPEARRHLRRIRDQMFPGVANGRQA
jgi:phospholipase C